jgi:hypothetical protein
MMTRENTNVGSRIRLRNGDIVRIKKVSDEMVSFEYEGRAAPKTDPLFPSAAYLRVEAPPPELIDPPAAAFAATLAEEYVNPVVTCRWIELASANLVE